MHEYESRVTDSTGTVTLISKGTYLNDFAAVRSAKQLCKVGESVEIWRGDLCIYSEYAHGSADLIWPVHRSVSR